MIDSTIPLPSLELATASARSAGAADPFAYYEELGRLARRDIVAQLPDDWTFDGRRVLDFGCGAGRTLRHFLDEARVSEIWGCDIDGDSIDWLSQHLCPPLHVFANSPEPPLDQPPASFDLIWSVSVFTHLTASWSRWLVELHRILKPGGLVLLTFIGDGLSELITGEPHSDERIGMNITRPGQSWDLGGPMVIHSPWWVAEHWGRGFDVVSLVPNGFASASKEGQGSVLLRKRDEPLDTEQLERHRPGDDREVPALMHNVAQLAKECEALRSELGALESGRRELERSGADLRAQLGVIENSKSWILTRPLRGAAEWIRRARSSGG